MIEDKKDKILHESKILNQPVKYAVDGAIHYGKKLSKEFLHSAYPNLKL